MANKNQTERSYDELTEACPKLTRRLKTGPALTFAAWVQLWIDRWTAQRDAMPRPTDRTGDKWYVGTMEYLNGQIRAGQLFLTVLPDKFSSAEWSAAVAKVEAMVGVVERHACVPIDDQFRASAGDHDGGPNRES